MLLSILKSILILIISVLLPISATIVQYTEVGSDVSQVQEIRGRILTGQTLSLYTININSVSYVKNNEELIRVADFPTLRNLNLDNSNHRYIPELKNLPSLENLYMEKNDILYIPYGRFTSIPIVYLFLRYNNIQQIEDSSFGKNLKHLYLSCNNLQYFEPKWFTNPTKLEVLDLDANKITSLQPNAFIQFINLKYIYLLHNGLHTIGPGAFSGRTYYDEVWLGFNNLTKLPSNAFQNYEITIEVFDISFNKLTYLEQDFMTKFKQKTTPYIDGNPWECSCYHNIIQWVNWRTYNKRKGVERGDPSCVVSLKNSVCEERVNSEIIQYFQQFSSKNPENRYSYCKPGFAGKRN